MSRLAFVSLLDVADLLVGLAKHARGLPFRQYDGVRFAFDAPAVMKMATYDNAQLIKMCGRRDPYPGKLGEISEGALADLILVDGNPLIDINLVADPDKNFDVIMKNGTIYKNNDK